MKISEMSLDELRDYALKLEEEKTAATEREHTLTSSLNEANELNKTLQKRNNELFLKVEQQITGAGEPAQEPKQAETCEEFARNLLKNKE